MARPVPALKLPALSTTPGAPYLNNIDDGFGIDDEDNIFMRMSHEAEERWAEAHKLFNKYHSTVHGGKLSGQELGALLHDLHLVEDLSRADFFKAIDETIASYSKTPRTEEREGGLTFGEFVPYYNDMRDRILAQQKKQREGELITTPAAVAGLLPPIGLTPKSVEDLTSVVVERKGKVLAVDVARSGSKEEWAKLFASDSGTLVADLEERDHDGSHPIVVAVANESWDVLGLLLDHGADPSLMAAERGSLKDISQNGSRRQIRKMVIKLYGEAALERAGLFQSAVDMDIESAKGHIQNLYYGGRHRLRSARDLYDERHGKDTQKRARDRAGRKRKGPQLSALEQKKVNFRFVKACKENNEEKMREFITSGADVNQTDSSGSTPLIHAVWIGKIECIQLLVEACADVNVANARGNTAMHFAHERFHAHVIAYLNEHGGKPSMEMKNKLGFTPPELEGYIKDNKIGVMAGTHGAKHIAEAKALAAAAKSGDAAAAAAAASAAAAAATDIGV